MSGHSLIEKNRLSYAEATHIADVLESGRRWCRRGRAGYSLAFKDGKFVSATLDESVVDPYAFEDREQFIEWLCALDLTPRGYSNSWSYLKVDFGLETLEEWQARMIPPDWASP